MDIKKGCTYKSAHPFLLFIRSRGVLLTLLHLSFQVSEYIEVAKSGACSNILNLRSFILLLTGSGCLASSTFLFTLCILEGAAVREDDTLAVLVELNNLEGQFLALLSL